MEWPQKGHACTYGGKKKLSDLDRSSFFHDRYTPTDNNGSLLTIWPTINNMSHILCFMFI